MGCSKPPLETYLVTFRVDSTPFKDAMFRKEPSLFPFLTKPDTAPFICKPGYKAMMQKNILSETSCMKATLLKHASEYVRKGVSSHSQPF